MRSMTLRSSSAALSQDSVTGFIQNFPAFQDVP
jgi:hypothetical protein